MPGRSSDILYGFIIFIGDTTDESQENNVSYSLASRLVILVEVPDGHSLNETMGISTILGGLAFVALNLDCRRNIHASTIAVGNSGKAKYCSLNKLCYSSSGSYCRREDVGFRQLNAKDKREFKNRRKEGGRLAGHHDGNFGESSQMSIKNVPSQEFNQN